MCWLIQKAKILQPGAGLLVLLIGLAPLSAFPAGTDSCSVMVSEKNKRESGREVEFHRVPFRIVGVKDGISVNKTGFLENDDVAVTFSLDGKIRLFYGDMEAIFERKSDVTFEMIPAIHELDITQHDVILIYKNLPGSVHKSIKALFDYGSGKNPVVRGYNCVDAVCRIMTSGSGDEVQTNIFHQERAFSELVSMHKYRSDMKAEIYVSQRAGSLDQFYQKLKDERSSDGLSRAERAAKGVISHAVVGVMFGAPVLAALYTVWDMMTY